MKKLNFKKHRKVIIPTRAENGTIRFSDYFDFTPNQTPAEMLSLGVFGGNYFRRMFI